MDKFKSVAKNGWHPEKDKTDSGSSGGGGQSDSKFGQVVCPRHSGPTPTDTSFF